MSEPIETREYLRQGIEAAKSGEVERARYLLRAAAQADPHVESTWLWLASVTAVPEEAITHLERALTINPFNRRARAWMGRLREQQRRRAVLRPRYRTKAKPHPGTRQKPGHASDISPWQCPVCSQSFIVRPARCVRCHAAQEVNDLYAFSENIEVDEGLLAAAIERLKNDEKNHDSQYHRTFALILLNCHRYREALAHLFKATALSPYDTALSRTACDLMRRLERSRTRRIGLRGWA